MNNYFSAIKRIAMTDFKLRDQASVLGFIWTLLHPLLMFLILFVIFSKRLGDNINEFGIYLLTGIVLWNYFASSSQNGLISISKRAQIIKNIKIDYSVFIIGSSITSIIIFLIEIIVLALFFAYFRFIPDIKGMFLFFLVLVFYYIFNLGLNFILATLFVYFRDMSHIWSIITKVGFFLTPIFYPIELVPEKYLIFYLANPVTAAIKLGRDALMIGTIDVIYFLYLLLVSILTLLIGYIIFRKGSDNIAEIL